MLEANPGQDDTMKEAVRAATEAKACADKGDWDTARALMAQAIDAAENATYHALMAWYTYQCSLQPAFERQRLAEHHLSVALEMDPDNHQAHYYQGLIWAGGGNTTRARIALAQALTLNPKFAPAAQALDKLSKPVESTKEAARPTFRRPSKARRVIPLAIATVLVGAAGGGFLYVSGQPPGVSELARQLGTRLPITSSSRVGSSGQDLHLDVGKAWATLPPSEQTNEMHNIAKAAKGMGLVNVFVYSESHPVAEVHGEEVCVGDCVTKAATLPTSSGKALQATLKVKKP
jgi:tetratricopeptide (TPR) repeat protein